MINSRLVPQVAVQCVFFPQHSKKNKSNYYKLVQNKRDIQKIYKINLVKI